MKNNPVSNALRSIVLLPIIFLIILFFHSPLLAQQTNEENTPEVDISDTQPPVQADETGEPIPEDVRKKLEALESELNELREQMDVRKRLEPTEQEKTMEEEEILTAAGREYTLLPFNTLELEYSFGYSYESNDLIREALEIEQRANHTITNSFLVDYAIMNNLTLLVSLPFVYKYHERNTGGQTDDFDVNDFGDMSLGFQYQPFKISESFPSTILRGNIILPTGRSQYEINPETELSTGNGFYAASVGASMSQSIDPVVIYGSLGFGYKFEEGGLNQNRPGGVVLEKVKPGESFSASVGFGYALTYNFSFNLSYSYSYSLESEYYWEGIGKTESGTDIGSSIGIGCGLRLSNGQSILASLSIGLTDDSSDFGLSIRLPFRFDLNGE